MESCRTQFQLRGIEDEEKSKRDGGIIWKRARKKR